MEPVEVRRYRHGDLRTDSKCHGSVTRMNSHDEALSRLLDYAAQVYLEKLLLADMLERIGLMELMR